MARVATIYRVFIASPGDCGEERNTIPQVLSEWNREHSVNMAILFEPVLYETDVRPEPGARPQDIINWQLIADSDILIACFWTRIGSSDDGIPHTVEELNQFIDIGKPALLYFSARPAPLEQIDTDQWQQLKKFKDQCQDTGLYASYKSLEEFKSQLRRHLTGLAFSLNQDREAAIDLQKPVRPRRTSSKYRLEKDLQRLKIQADNILAFDSRAITAAVKHIRSKSKDRHIRIMDLGCADGYITKSRFVNLENVTVLGIDRDREVIESAANRFACRNISFEAADITDRSLTLGEFDLVFCALTLHHLANPEGIMSRLWSRLSPGGAIIVRSPDDGLKLTYPSSEDFDRLLHAPSQMPGSSDRIHGRKIYTQMQRLNPPPAKIDMFFDAHTTAGLSKDERHAFFLDHYGHRLNYAELNAARPNATSADKKLYAKLKRTLKHWEGRFKSDDCLFSLTVNIIGCALKKH